MIRISTTTTTAKSIIIWLTATILSLVIKECFGQSCGPRINPRLLKDNNVIPCDINSIGYCIEPGHAYPWNSMKRFIFENQGFVRKMYGEQRQSQIIHNEIERLNNIYQDYSSQSSNDRQQRKYLAKFNNDNDGGGDNEHNQATTTIKSTIDSNDDSITDNSIINESISSSLSTNQSINTNILVDNNDINHNNNIFVAEDENNDDFGNNDDDDGMTTTTVKTPTTTTTTSTNSNKGYNACPIQQEVVAPYWANNTRGEILALLNVYPFEQYIHWEKCTNEYEQMYCRDGCRCEQQYRLHRLLAFDPRNECRGIFADWFRFPGCCVCICYDYFTNNENDDSNGNGDGDDQQNQQQQQQQQHERINNRKARL